MRRYIAALFVALSPSLAFAQKDANVPDPDPELERKTFIVPDGFEVTLWAADPLLAKPIQMNFDPQGRLWVASSEIYPQIKPGEKANDKIIILEDTKGGGKADKTTVFADGLLIPTGVVPGDGGAYVANSTELVFLSASKPGGKADQKKVLLSGFGTEDTHHIIHTFRWGPDCRLYFNQSVYIHSHIETPHGVKRLNAGGIWRFNPDTTELDIFARGWWNAWGHAFDKYGQSLVTDGAGGEGINHVVPGGYYAQAQGPHSQRILHGLNPGSPKYCGLEIISGRHFPDDWQDNLITCDFRGHRVCRFKLADDGSTFASREVQEVIKSSHGAFRPIDVKMGPDGALYIADWYNPIIQHGEVDFRDPRRDKTHGRIWRVAAKNRNLVEKPKLVDATIPELLDQLKSPEQWTRDQAKRVLKERGREKVLPELRKWRLDLGANDEHARAEGTWMMLALGDITDFPLVPFKDTNNNVALARTLPDLIHCPPPATFTENEKLRWQAIAKLARRTVTKQILDDNPRVRLAVIRGVTALESLEAVEIAIKALDKPMDRTLDYALWLTLRELEPYWMPEFKAGRLDFGGDPKKIAFALSAASSKDTIKPVLALLDSGKLPKESAHGMWLVLAQIGGPDELTRVLGHSVHEQAAQRGELVQAVEDAIRTRKVPAPKNATGLTELIALDEAVRRPAMRIAGLWKVQDQKQKLSQIAIEAKTSTDDRRAALEGLVAMGPADETLNTLLNPKATAEQRRDAIIAFAGLNLAKAATQAGNFLPDAKPDDALSDLYAAFVNRKGGASTLAKALAGKKLPTDVAKIGLKAIRASGQPADDLVAALTKAGDLGAAKKAPTPDEVKALALDAVKNGDVVRGEAVYRRREMQCLACHAYAGAGGQVGPDLTSIGASAQADYLVESLLLPSKAIKEGYHALRVVTNDEKVYQGTKVREADGMLVLRTAEDKEITLPVKDIAERAEATKSLMPEGLTDQLTKQDFADLVKYLSELGKVGGPFAPSKVRAVRRWQLIEPTQANMNLFRRTRVSAATEADNPFMWSPVYSKVAGDLPLAELPKYSVWNDTAAQTVLRFQLDVTTAGAAKLKFNSVAGLTLYVGNSPVEAKAETLLDLKAGVQTVTVVLDRSKRTDDVRIELDDVEKSPARVGVVGGK